MFQIGDGVVHPVHGVGIITDISSKDISGEPYKYYVINLITINMRLLVPVDNAEKIGLYRALGKPEAEKMLSVVSAPAEPLPQDYRKRQACVASALRSGNVLRTAEAFRDLAWRRHRKRLSAGDSRLLERLKRFLSGQLALAQDMDLDEASTLIESTVENTLWQTTVSDGVEGTDGAEISGPSSQ